MSEVCHNWGMRRKGTDEQLAERRVGGLALLEQGKKPKEVAEILYVTRRSVNRWQQEAQKPKKKKARRMPGRPRKLSERQVKRLDKGAYAFGYVGNNWTLDRISQVIWQLFRVRHHPSAVWHMTRRMAGAASDLSAKPCSATTRRSSSGKQRNCRG